MEETESVDLIVITSNRVALDENSDAVPATLEISALDGKFVGIRPRKAIASDYPSTVRFHDCGDLVIMPGLVDSHVHINEPYLPGM
jgi:allantoinase